MTWCKKCNGAPGKWSGLCLSCEIRRYSGLPDQMPVSRASYFESNPLDDPESCESMYGMSNADFKDGVNPDEGDHG